MSRSLEELRELADRDVADPASEERDGDAEGRTETATSSESGAEAGTGTGRGADGETGSRTLLGRSPVRARGFLLAVAALVGGLVVGGAVPLVGGLTRYAGLFVAAFLLGALRSRRAYLETALAGALAAGGAFVLGTLTTGNLLVGSNLLAEYGVPIAGIGVGVGALLSLAGVYFGRDLRAGLTRDLE